MAGKASDIKAGGAFVELFVKDEKLAKGLESAKGKLESFGRAVIVGKWLMEIASGILEPVKKAVEGFAEWTEGLTKMSERTGVAATELQKLEYIAQQSGTSLEDVEKALKFFEHAGHSPRQFMQLLENLAHIDSAGLRAKRAIELFGKRGTMLIPMIETLHNLGGEFDGLMLTEEQIKAGDELATAFTRLRRAIKAAMDQIAAAVAPVVTVSVEWFSILAKTVAGLARDFPLLTEAVVGLSVAVLALGAAFVFVAGAGTILAGVVAVLDVLLTPLGLIAAAVVLLIAYWAMLTAVLAGVTTWFVTCTQTGKALLNRVMQPLYAILRHFKSLGDVFATTFRGLSAALKFGDVGKAWEILCLGMTVAFKTFAATVLRDIQRIIAGLWAIAKASGQELLAATIQVLMNRVGISAKELETEAAKKQKELEAKAAALKQKEKQPGDRGYGLGEQSAVATGTSARAALMGRQIAGGGRDEKMLDTLTKILLANATSNKELMEIRRKIGAKFGP